MVTVLNPPTEPRVPFRRRLLAFASKPGLVAGAGIFTVIVGALFGAGWLSIHHTYWRGRWEGSASLRISTIQRHSLTVAAATAAVIATVAILQIARRSPPRTITVAIYWLATVSLWVTLALMLFGASIDVRAYARGLPL